MAVWPESFLAALEHVVGPQQQMATIGIGSDDDMEKRRAEIVDTARRVDAGRGVIILTDMFGGTPPNARQRALYQWPNNITPRFAL